jgi:hypothetical protein
VDRLKRGRNVLIYTRVVSVTPPSGMFFPDARQIRHLRNGPQPGSSEMTIAGDPL